MEQCSVRDAALKLQEWFGVRAGESVPESPPPPSASLSREEKGEEDEEKNKPLTFTLRGIDHSHSYLAERGIKKETAEHFGVGFFSGRGSMSGRVVIPIHNTAGELVAYAGRSIDKSEPKYKLPVGFKKSQVLFNLHSWPKLPEGVRGVAIVVEGFFDCMKVHQAGVPQVVALMGSSLSAPQEELLAEYADEVVLMLDDDEAGQKATAENLTRLARKMFVRVVDVPEGHQPDQLSDEELQQLLAGCI
jgi:DNA primase